MRHLLCRNMRDGRFRNRPQTDSMGGTTHEPGDKIAVCDDLAEDRENITRLLSEYTDKNNLYVKIEGFPGEAFLSSDTSVYSCFYGYFYEWDETGMETAKKLISRNSRVQIVFGSTSTEFAAEAFDIEALHYMVKPVRKEKLFHILDRFFDSVYSLRTVNVKSGMAGGEHLHFRYSVCRSRWKTSENSHEKGRDRCFHVYGRSGKGSASQ